MNDLIELCSAELRPGDIIFTRKYGPRRAIEVSLPWFVISINTNDYSFTVIGLDGLKIVYYDAFNEVILTNQVWFCKRQSDTAS